MLEALFRVSEGQTLVVEGKPTPLQFAVEGIALTEFAALVAPDVSAEAAPPEAAQEVLSDGLPERVSATAETMETVDRPNPRQLVVPTELANVVAANAPALASIRDALPQGNADLSITPNPLPARAQAEALAERSAPPAITKGVGIVSVGAPAIGLSQLAVRDPLPARPSSKGEHPQPQSDSRTDIGKAVQEPVRPAPAAIRTQPEITADQPARSSPGEPRRQTDVPTLEKAVAPAAPKIAEPPVTLAPDAAAPKARPEIPLAPRVTSAQPSPPPSRPPLEAPLTEADRKIHTDLPPRTTKPEGTSPPPVPAVSRPQASKFASAAREAAVENTGATVRRADDTRQPSTVEIPSPQNKLEAPTDAPARPDTRAKTETGTAAKEPQLTAAAAPADRQEQPAHTINKASAEPQMPIKTPAPDMAPLPGDIPVDLKSELPIAQRAHSESVAQTTPIAREAAGPEPTTRATISQVSEAITRSDGDKVDVRLSPEELGRVRLSLGQSEHGLHVQLTAERGETLDLMRRHIALLEADLRQNGFSNLTFSFGESGDGRGQRQTGGDDLIPEELTEPDAPFMRSPEATGRIDIRL